MDCWVAITSKSMHKNWFFDFKRKDKAKSGKYIGVLLPIPGKTNEILTTNVFISDDASFFCNVGSFSRYFFVGVIVHTIYLFHKPIPKPNLIAVLSREHCLWLRQP